MEPFLPGLELNRAFYWDAIRPILSSHFPDLVHSAALIGYGSDVLGFDTAVSTDHEWGPRALLFLSEDDNATLATAIVEALQQELPTTFHGYSTSFSPHDSSGVRHMTPGLSGKIAHHVEIHILRSFLQRELEIDPERSLTTRDWLSFPEQRLLHITAGAVYHDGLQLLEPMRNQFHYYPHDVWLYRLASQWMRISQEEAFMGRCGDVGDDLGSRIIAARLVRDLMKLRFLQVQRYAPYSKWLGSAFALLPGADSMGPHLTAALTGDTWREREQHLSAAYELVATWQNGLGIAEFHAPQTQSYYERPYQVIRGDRFADALVAAIQDPELKGLVASVGLIGGLDQYIDSTDVLERPLLCQQFRALLES